MHSFVTPQAWRGPAYACTPVHSTINLHHVVKRMREFEQAEPSPAATASHVANTNQPRRQAICLPATTAWRLCGSRPPPSQGACYMHRPGGAPPPSEASHMFAPASLTAARPALTTEPRQRCCFSATGSRAPQFARLCPSHVQDKVCTMLR